MLVDLATKELSLYHANRRRAWWRRGWVNPWGHRRPYPYPSIRRAVAARMPRFGRRIP